MEKIVVRGIPFDKVTISQALDLAKDALKKESITIVVTPNAEIAQMCIENETIANTIKSADIILPDGAGVLLASEILGTPLPEKVAGVEFGEKLLSFAAESGYRVFLLGGKHGVAEIASRNLQEKYPSLFIAGTHDGYFEKEGKENDDVIRAILRAKTDILLVCLGAPLQEMWITQNKEALAEIRLAACLGGSLDVYAGIVKRAPNFFIRMRAEWLYRLIKEPKRLRRMMKLPQYILGAKKEAREKQRSQNISRTKK